MRRPQVRIIFTLNDGTTRSKDCDIFEALRQMAEAKSYPSRLRDFRITESGEECKSA